MTSATNSTVSSDPLTDSKKKFPLNLTHKNTLELGNLKKKQHVFSQSFVDATLLEFLAYIFSIDVCVLGTIAKIKHTHC